MFVGFPPGGGVDVIARLLAARTASSLGQPVIVENRSGANGNVAMEATARAASDGYTLFFGNIGNLAINNELYAGLSFDTLRDLAPVAQVNEHYFYMAVAARVAAATLGEFIALARANPGRLSFGSPGMGSAHHLGFELFRRPLDLDIVHVPYRGEAPALQDLAAGTLDFTMGGYGALLPFVESRRARILATTASQRLSWLPDMPTVAEAAPLRGYDLIGWMAVMAPAATPPVILQRLQDEIAAALTPGGEVARALDTRGVTAKFRDAAATRALIEAERQRWGRVIREARITAVD
jgi:tripartite-type tricarboxylate transporter receptor subunit TctC